MIHQRTQNDDHKHKESVPSNSGPNHVFSTVKRKQIRFAIRRTAAIGTAWFFSREPQAPRERSEV